MLNLLSMSKSTRFPFPNKVSCHRYSFSFFSTTVLPSSYSLRNDSTIHESSISQLDRTAKQNRDCSSLKNLLWDLSDVVPNITRSFRRFPILKPENVLELLLGFESELQRNGTQTKKVRALWETFKLSSDHLPPQAYEIMASILIRNRMVKEAELLLMEIENNGVTLSSERIYCDLIDKYVEDYDSNKAVQMFDWMRRKGLVPLTSCYKSLTHHLVRVHLTDSAYRVCLDWVTTTTTTTNESKNLNVDITGKVIELLCLDQKVHEARVLARKLVALGCNLNSSMYSYIALGYCKKQDFDDLLSFINEVKYEPVVSVGNRIVHTLCKTFGSERAYVYMEELEKFGFKPDEVTFGVLIGWCCNEGDIKRAFIYLSEITTKGLKPEVYSYNAILSGLFRKGLWEHTDCVVDEMKENGIVLGLSTFKIMITGYCKARRFEEAKKIVNEMVGHELTDPLNEAFSLIGFDPLAVRLKRDNGNGLSKAEFFDELGNGLYLDTDLDAYEQKVNTVLDRAVLPEFNLLIVKACNDGDLQKALGLLDEMSRWGQTLSRKGFTVLVKSLCVSRGYVRVSVSLLGKWPKLANQLDGETLNFLVKEFCKKGLSRQSKHIFYRMVQRNFPIDNASYTSLICCFCKKETLSDVFKMWDAAKDADWLPELDKCGSLWECLLQKGLVNESVKLFDRIFISQSEVCRVFVEKLTIVGFSRIAHSVVKRLEGEGYVVEEEVYNHLIKGLCKEKNDSVAFAILDEMLDKKYMPSLGSCLMLIPRLCIANKTVKAFALAEGIDSSSVYKGLVEGLCLAGMMVDAEKQLRLMLSNRISPDKDIFNRMFQGYCKGNNLRKVEEVLGVMLRKNVDCSVTSYRDYIRKMCLERRFLSAKNILLLRESNPGDIIIYNLLIFYLFQAKESSEVNKVLLEMERRGLLFDEATFNFLIYGYSLCGDDSSSLRYLTGMISEGMKPNCRSVRVVINSLCENGDVRKALDLWKVMESKGSVALTKIVESGETPNYDSLIKKLADRGSLDISVNLLNVMLKNRRTPDSLSYDSVINGFLRCDNRLDKAMDFHTEMLELGLSPSLSTWSRLVHNYCEAGQVLESERLLKAMVRLGETPSKEMFKIVIDGFRAERNTVKASEMMDMMQKCGYEIDFETHWSLISNMSSYKEKKTTTAGQGFLSRLLSGNGLALKR